jgi:transposase InsO family protein
MIPNMSRPARPYDNASCESFRKTLKREDIYVKDIRISLICAPTSRRSSTNLGEKRMFK